MKFLKDQSEDYYRKLLLLNKVKPILSFEDKKYIFFQGYCWDLIAKDNDAAWLCYLYATEVLVDFFDWGEPIIYSDDKASRFYVRIFYPEHSDLWDH